MKTPLAVYPIAVWVFMQSTLGVILPVRIVGRMITGSSELSSWFRGMLGLLVIVLMVLLVQLRPIARKIAIALLSTASLMIGNMFLGGLKNGYTGRQIVAMAAMFSLNILCIVYMNRTRFVTACIDRQAEREERIKEKDRQKRMDSLSNGSSKF